MAIKQKPDGLEVTVVLDNQPTYFTVETEREAKALDRLNPIYLGWPDNRPHLKLAEVEETIEVLKTVGESRSESRLRRDMETIAAELQADSSTPTG